VRGCTPSHICGTHLGVPVSPTSASNARSRSSLTDRASSHSAVAPSTSARQMPVNSYLDEAPHEGLADEVMSRGGSRTENLDDSSRVLMACYLRKGALRRAASATGLHNQYNPNCPPPQQPKHTRQRGVHRQHKRTMYGMRARRR
jgi:hypothetical protein